jgi:2OG-Fe(II) oxygenase superfamily
MLSRFRWTTFDVNDLLPQGWQQEVDSLAADADFRLFPRTPVVSREAADVSQIRRGRVNADQVRQRLPWLDNLYRGAFLDLARDAWTEIVATACDSRYGLVLDVQRGSSMRFECHVDSNPLTGLLFCTEHQAGGELAFSNDPAATGLAEVERDCSIVRPHAGHLVFFDARDHPHYARPLRSTSDVRILAAMNFYTESCPEETRPKELNKHLYGDG